MNNLNTVYLFIIFDIEKKKKAKENKKTVLQNKTVQNIFIQIESKPFADELNDFRSN
jgi:hypothetical protein